MANPEQSPVATASYMVLMAADKESLPAMLYGTKLSWNNPAQALRDLANAGDYTEEALVTFPDGSTVVKKFALHVTAPAAVNNGGNHNGAHIDGNQVVDGQGHVISGLTVKNGRIEITGWYASNLALGCAYHTIIVLDAQTNREIARTMTKKISRDDVARAYPMIANANQSGFDVSFDLNPAFVNDNLRVVSRWSASEDANSDYVDYWFNPTKLSIDRGNYAHMDSVTSNQNKVTVSGWNATNESFGRKYHYIIAFDKKTNREITRQLVQNVARPDVAKAFPNEVNAGQSGFTASFDLTPAMANDQITYISRWSADPAGNNDYADYWFDPVQKINRACLDKESYNAKQNTLNVAGWHANDASIYEPYHILILFDATTRRKLLAKRLSKWIVQMLRVHLETLELPVTLVSIIYLHRSSQLLAIITSW